MVLADIARSCARKWLSSGVKRNIRILLTEFRYRFKRNRVREAMQRLHELPQTLHLEITNTCNARCCFCAYPSMIRPKQIMSMDLFRKIVAQYIEIGGHEVSLTPIVGDPFTDPFLFDRLDHLQSTPEIHSFYFYTNAIRMTPATGDRLLTYEDKLKVFISLGGLDQETYKTLMGVDHFDDVMANIDALVCLKRAKRSKLQLAVALRCPKSKLVGSHWENLQAWSRDGLIRYDCIDGYDNWAGKVSSATLRSLGLEPLGPIFLRGPCQILMKKPIALADGRVNACACRDVEAELCIGDLSRESLQEVWRGSRLQEIIAGFDAGEYPEVCMRCSNYISVYDPRAAME